MAAEFDRQAALAFLEEEALLYLVVKAFVESAQEPLQQFRQAIDHKDSEGVRRYLHRVSPSLKLLATVSLNDQLQAVHEQWRSAVPITKAHCQQARLLAQRIALLLDQAASEIKVPGSC